MPLDMINFNIYQDLDVQNSSTASNYKHAGFGQRIKTNGFIHNKILSPSETARKITQSYGKEGMTGVKTVVIDAGHGGHDPGTSGRYEKEKNIALKIAVKLAKQIQLQHPDVSIILTRDKDVFIPLHERAKIANDAKADLFISIHCNALRNSSATAGTETYVLGNHRMEDNLQVAMRENSAILFEQDYESIYNFDPNSPEGYIIMSMYQDVYQEQSIRFAQKVEGQIAHVGSKKSRGVKQAGFLVLRETAMPSVLVETGFLTNRSDEAYLRSSAGQDEMAAKISQAFSEYKREINFLTRNDKAVETIESPSAQSKSIQSNKAPLANTGFQSVEKGKKTLSDFKSKTGTNKQYNYSSSSSNSNEFTSKGQTSAKASEKQISIKVQLAASKKRMDLSLQPWSSIDGQIEVVQEGGFYKYLYGNFSNRAEAERKRLEYQRAGFPSAFTVYYREGKRIKQEEALKALKKNL